DPSEILPCPACRQQLRVPTNEGTLQLTCPKCRHYRGWTAPPQGETDTTQRKPEHRRALPKEFNWPKAAAISFGVSLFFIVVMWRDSNYSEPGKGVWAPGYRHSGLGTGTVVTAKEADEQRRNYQAKPLGEKLFWAALAWACFGGSLLFMGYLWHRD